MMDNEKVPEAKKTERTIQLTCVNGAAHCFNTDDYMTIRVEHRIPGKLIGCCPDYPFNSNLVGLPAVYTPYEARLLAEKGYAVLVGKDFSKPPSDEVKRQYKEILVENEEAIIAYCRENRIAESSKNIGKIVAGKRKKWIARGLDPNEITIDSVMTELRDNFKFNPDHVSIEIPTEEPFHVDTKVISELPLVDPLMYRVFVHFWELGKWVTLGDRFGADFMLYPGETLYYHASHLVHVIRNVRDKQIPVTELITKGRLSIVVNKFCVFAFEHPETKELCFQTLQWQGSDKQ